MRIHNRTSTRLIASILFFALIFAQISISVHAVQHPDHINSIHSSDSIMAASLDVTPDPAHNEDNAPHKTHKCPECLLVKSFQSALIDCAAFNLGVLISAQNYFFVKNDIIRSIVQASYQARAPPSFLI